MACQGKCNITTHDMGYSVVKSCAGCGRVWELPKKVPTFPPGTEDEKTEVEAEAEVNTPEQLAIEQALPFTVVVFGDEK